jgi:enoyl-[acyl-carrier protein] reductase II
MKNKNRICTLLEISYPIVQAGMVWCSGWKLASAVSNAGGLGVIGSGSMYPEVLCEHIKKCFKATDKPFAVNLPLMYPEVKSHINTIIKLGVKIVITSAGTPQTWTSLLKENGIKVIHVISNIKFAKKSEDAGVDAVIAEGFEAGGHNGREETTTFCLVPLIKEAVSIPVIAAGGIATGKAMFAAMVLGAEGVQIGTRFAASEESSAHMSFKEMIVNATDGETMLSLKKLIPVRLFKNDFFYKINNLESAGESTERLRILLGAGRPKKGIFEGDLNEGELETGQVCAQVNKIEPAKEILLNIWQDYLIEYKKINCFSLNY